jgi:hypothetical protein
VGNEPTLLYFFRLAFFSPFSSPILPDIDPWISSSPLKDLRGEGGLVEFQHRRKEREMGEKNEPLIRPTPSFLSPFALSSPLPPLYLSTALYLDLYLDPPIALPLSVCLMQS